MLRNAVEHGFANNFAISHKATTITSLARGFATDNKSNKIDRSRPLPPPAYAASRLNNVTSDQEALTFMADPLENHAYESNDDQSSTLEGPRSGSDIRAMNKAFHDHQEQVRHHKHLEEAFDRRFGSAKFAADHQGLPEGDPNNHDALTDNMTVQDEHAYDQDRETWRPDNPRSGNDARTFRPEFEADFRAQAAQVRLGGQLPGQDKRDQISRRAERDKQEVFGRDTPTTSGTRERDLASMRSTGIIGDDQPEREINNHARK